MSVIECQLQPSTGEHSTSSRSFSGLTLVEAVGQELVPEVLVLVPVWPLEGGAEN